MCMGIWWYVVYNGMCDSMMYDSVCVRVVQWISTHHAHVHEQ